MPSPSSISTQKFKISLVTLPCTKFHNCYREAYSGMGKPMRRMP